MARQREVKQGHSWNRVFWLGFPAIIALSWTNQIIQHILPALVFYGASLVWILCGVKSICRTTRESGLLTTYARFSASMGFAALVAVGLLAVQTLGTLGHLSALAFWLGLHLLARALLA